MKKALIIIAAIVVVLIVALVIAPFFIPVATYKGRLIAAVKDSTGRELRIDGPVSLSLFPTLALEANKVSFANAPGASSKDMATLAQLQVQLKVLPLLHKDIQLKRLVLVDPVIALEVDKQGRPNWQFSEGQKPQQPAPQAKPGAAPSSAGGLSGLSLDDVRLVNGRISYLDHRSGEKQELTDIGMTVSLPSLDGPFTADGAAVWRNEKMTLALSVANPRAFMDGKNSAAAFKLAARPISFDFKGEGAGSTPAKLDGTVELQVPSVRGLASWAGTPLKLPGSGYGPLAISGKASMAGPKIAFSNANLSLDNINAKGELALDSGGARPSLRGRLDVDKLDANPYLPPETQGKAAAGGGQAGAPGGGATKSSDWSDEPLDLSGLKSADIDFALTAGGLQYRKIQVGKSALALKLQDGRFEADLTELALYQGAGTGKVVVDGSGAVPGVTADFNLHGVQIQPLLHDAADLDRLSGTGAFTLAVNGHGKSQRAIISALNGKGDLNLANGVIKGLNLVAMVKNVAASFQGAQRGADQTDFTALSGTYTINDGILRNNDLQLKSAEIPMTGAGSVDLPRRTVDYKITPKIAGAVAVPVVIKGPWDNLSYQPDLAGMVGDPSKLLQKGEKGLGGALKGAPNADQLLKGLLGGQKK